MAENYDPNSEYYESIDNSFADNSNPDLANILNNLSKNDIQEYILEKLLYFYRYNDLIKLKIKQNYNNNGSNYFEEFCILNNEWISKFLSFYNYEKIFQLLNHWNGEITVKALSSELLLNNIKQKSESMPHEMSDKELFRPKIINLNGMNYYTNFIIIENNLFQRLKNDNGNINLMNYNFEFEEPMKVNICFTENKFIYKIDDYSLGFGIVNNKNNYPLLNIDFIMILNKESGFNSDTEINQLFNAQNFETFFTINRQIDFGSNENPKIIYQQMNIEIGKFYSLDSFLYDNYFKKSIYENKKKFREESCIKENDFLSVNGNTIKEHSIHYFGNNNEDLIDDNINIDNTNEINIISTNKNIQKNNYLENHNHSINKVNKNKYNSNDYSQVNNKNTEKTEIIEEKISILNETNKFNFNTQNNLDISLKISSKNEKLKIGNINFKNRENEKEKNKSINIK